MKRDGLAVTIDSKHSDSSKDFIIRRVLRLRGTCLTTALASMSGVEHIDDQDLSEIKRCLSNIEKGKYTEASVMLDYRITLHDFKVKDDTLYHYQTDLLLSFKNTVDIVPHPYSTKFLNIGSFGVKHDYKGQRELNLKIRLVDHSPLAPKRYMKLLDKVYELKPQREGPYRKGQYKNPNGGKPLLIEYTDYLEIYYSEHSDPMILNGNGVGYVRYSLEEAKENMGLYDTLNDAINSGSVETTRKEQLNAKQHDLEMLRADILRRKTLMEQEDLVNKTKLNLQERDLEKERTKTLELKLTLERLQATLATEAAEQKQTQVRLDTQLQQVENTRTMVSMQRKTLDENLDRERKENEARVRQEAMYWKEHYEIRSMHRKDNSEMIKYVPGIIIAAAGLVGIYAKISSSNN
jgi:hypothetical protein